MGFCPNSWCEAPNHSRGDCYDLPCAHELSGGILAICLLAQTRYICRSKCDMLTRDMSPGGDAVAYLRFQVVLEKRIKMGKISNLPMSISAVRVSLLKSLR